LREQRVEPQTNSAKDFLDAAAAKAVRKHSTVSEFADGKRRVAIVVRRAASDPATIARLSYAIEP
jgi:hypothetical protein